MLFLKDQSDINAVIASSDYSSIDSGRKAALVAHFQGMLPASRQSTLNILADIAPTIEVSFSRALFVDAPTIQTPAVTTPPSFPEVTSVGDGASGALESVPTADLPLPQLREFIVATTGEPQMWSLATGEDATDAAHQRPNDFHPTNNSRVWTRKR